MNVVDVIRSLAGFAWLGVIGLGVLAIARASRNQGAKGIGTTVVIVLIVAIVLTTLGYSADQPREKIRKPLAELVRFEKW